MRYLYTSTDVRCTSSHQALSNIRMVNERSGIFVKETCGCLPQSSNECICQRERLLQVKQAFVY